MEIVLGPNRLTLIYLILVWRNPNLYFCEFCTENLTSELVILYYVSYSEIYWNHCLLSMSLIWTWYIWLYWELNIYFLYTYIFIYIHIFYQSHGFKCFHCLVFLIPLSFPIFSFCFCLMTDNSTKKISCRTSFFSGYVVSQHL